MGELKKFIVVQSEQIANKLMSDGFVLLSNVCGTYTFLNDNQKKQSFSNIELSKLFFTDRINI